MQAGDREEVATGAKLFTTNLTEFYRVTTELKAANAFSVHISSTEAKLEVGWSEGGAVQV